MKSYIIQYILKRLQETSTIKGLILFIASVAGLTLSAEQTNAAVYIVLGIVGLVGASLPDKIVDKPKEGKENETGDDRDSGDDAGRPESHPKADARVEQKEESPVRQGKSGNDWRVEPKGNDFDIVQGSLGWGDK